MGIREAFVGGLVVAFAFVSGCATSAISAPPPRAEVAPIVVPPLDVAAAMTPDLPPKSDEQAPRPRLTSTLRIGENNPDAVVDGANDHGAAANGGGQAVARATTTTRTYYRGPGFLSGSTSRSLSQGATNGYSNANGSYASPQSFGPRAMQ